MKKKTKIIALCGLMSALSTVLLTLAGLLPLATFVFPILAMLPVTVALEESDEKWALGVYLSSALLGMLLCADREAAVFYLLSGGFPILQRCTAKLKKPLAFFLKALSVNVALVLSYVVTARLFGIEDTEATGWLLLVTWLLGNCMFLLLDRVLVKLRLLYCLRWRKLFFGRN